ncbi:jun dimerization protein 2 isoform X1 [Hydra vulgaris]|uniref:jun dimerization protein 2 isoform X1 n=1 Tax=Hydra vulgaris TaxID=6087 RepID=UPI001F5EAF86|nr:jun dimerization protein 2-like [Hydra vulgaris]
MSLLTTPVLEQNRFVDHVDYFSQYTDEDSSTSFEKNDSFTIDSVDKYLVKEIQIKYNKSSTSGKKNDNTLTYENSQSINLNEKRNRNRLAAQRCRQKQKERIQYLEKDAKRIEKENSHVELEIKELNYQLDEIKKILRYHCCRIIPTK